MPSQRSATTAPCSGPWSAGFGAAAGVRVVSASSIVASRACRTVSARLR